jgi:hypothetical protein
LVPLDDAARFVLNKPHDYKKPDSTTKMVKDLNWGKSEQRRKRSDVTLVHKVVHHLIAVAIYHHPTMAVITSTRFVDVARCMRVPNR